MFTAVFDLDGTLADTAGDLLAAANAVFEDNGYGAPLNMDDRGTALKGGRSMLTLGAKRLEIEEMEAFVDAGYEPLLLHYRNQLSLHTKLYPQALDVLLRLRDTGWKLSVCTNKPIHLANPLLEELGVYEIFDSVIGARSLPVAKPHPEPLWEAIRLADGNLEKSVLIGDTKTDHDTAKAAQTAILLVDFDDSHIGHEFPQAPLVRDFEALEAWLQNWRKSKSESAD